VQPWASCLHGCASVTKQYNLVPANGRWCSAVGEVTAGLVESNGSLQPGLWLWSPAGWLPRTRISSGTLHSFKVWDYLFYLLRYCISAF